MKLIVEEEQAGSRLDSFLAQQQSELSRANWQKLIKEGVVTVNDQPSKASYSLMQGDKITFTIPPKSDIPAVELPILYEDDKVIVINKPSGVLVHPNNKLQREATVVDILADKLPQDGTLRPGIVHRLDRDTSGVMIVARNNTTRTYLQKQFQNRTVIKKYYAVCEGVFKDSEFIIDAPLRRSAKKPGTFMVSQHGKQAQTHVKVVKQAAKRALVELTPATGRTHQLRVHLKYTQHPIVGDRLYGKEATRLLLHASSLTLAVAHNNLQTFTAPLPPEFNV